MIFLFKICKDSESYWFYISNFDKERAQNSDAKCNVYSNQLDIIVMETILCLGHCNMDLTISS